MTEQKGEKKLRLAQLLRLYKNRNDTKVKKIGLLYFASSQGKLLAGFCGIILSFLNAPQCEALSPQRIEQIRQEVRKEIEELSSHPKSGEIGFVEQDSLGALDSKAHATFFQFYRKECEQHPNKSDHMNGPFINRAVTQSGGSLIKLSKGTRVQVLIEDSDQNNTLCKIQVLNGLHSGKLCYFCEGVSSLVKFDPIQTELRRAQFRKTPEEEAQAQKELVSLMMGKNSEPQAAAKTKYADVSVNSPANHIHEINRSISDSELGLLPNSGGSKTDKSEDEISTRKGDRDRADQLTPSGLATSYVNKLMKAPFADVANSYIEADTSSRDRSQVGMINYVIRRRLSQTPTEEILSITDQLVPSSYGLYHILYAEAIRRGANPLSRISSSDLVELIKDVPANGGSYFNIKLIEEFRARISKLSNAQLSQILEMLPPLSLSRISLLREMQKRGITPPE